ncbi:MAG: peptidoglycan bridge formation glycyltransferase FemA/FemB family protein [Patescibacteria group bacterium]
MEIKKIENFAAAHEFVSNHALASGAFLQTQFWGEFQKECGLSYWYLGAFDGEDLRGVALVLKISLPLGKSYLYCPKGPVVDPGSGALGVLLSEIGHIAKNEGSLFLRFEPAFPEEFSQKIQSQLKARIVKEVQPKSNWVLDVTKSGDELLSAMKQKTRYNIHLAEKKKLAIRKSCDAKDIELFFALADETAKRNGINTHSKNYYTKMMESLSAHGLVKLYLAEYDGKTIAANFMLYFGGVATYLHGGSNSEFRNLMAPYLLQWQAIQDAKNEGSKIYDFGGVSPENDDVHKWSGISRFKRGFGGRQINSVGTYDTVYSPFWYRLYTTVRKFR